MNIFGTKGYFVLLLGTHLFALMLPLGKWFTVPVCPSEMCAILKIYRCIGKNTKMLTLKILGLSCTFKENKCSLKCLFLNLDQ